MLSSSGAVAPNPVTYLNHLSPQEAIEYETTRNILLILLGATVWDILATISDDIKVLKRSRFRFATFCFIFSRCFAVAYVISNVMRRTKPTHNLYAAVVAGAALCGMSIGCSSYLFLQRTLAVYADSPRVRRFFTILWMVCLCSEYVLLFFLRPTYIPETEYFKDSGVPPMLSLTVVMIIIYDSSIFLAISYKIGIAHVVIEREVGWKRFILGKALPRLSRAVLRGGQQYYLIVFLVLLPGGILLYVPSTPPILRSMLTVFVAPLTASMACRAHRNTKLFEYDVPPPYPISEIQFV